MTTTDERAIIRQHSKSFSLAAKMLAPVVRRRAERLYAWCRYADDAIDHAPTPLDAMCALNRLRSELDTVYAGHTPTTPATAMLAAVVAEVNLPRLYPDELLRGMAMDVGNTRYGSLDELLVYCHRVAGVVGLMMCHAMGVSDDRALPHAAHLGIAMQLTNISRDVAEDWGRGRLYLPLDWLDGEPPADRPLIDERTAPVIRRLLDVANVYYTSGDGGLKYLDRRGRLAVRAARAVYSQIGNRVRASGCRPSTGRAVVPDWQKGLAVLAAVARTVADRGIGPVNPPAAVWKFAPLPLHDYQSSRTAGVTVHTASTPHGELT